MDEGASGTQATKEPTLKSCLSKEPALNLRVLEKAAIEVAWARVNYNVTRACKMLGIGRTTLYRKLKLYGIKEAA